MNRSKISLGSKGSNGSNGSGQQDQLVQRDPVVQIDESGPLGPTRMGGRGVSPISLKRDKISLGGGSEKPRRAPGGRDRAFKKRSGPKAFIRASHGAVYKSVFLI